MTEFPACLRSGYCCKQRPCPFGEVVSSTDRSCRYLEGDRPGHYRCGIYEFISRQPASEYANISPAFGGGCCSPLNSDRTELREDK